MDGVDVGTQIILCVLVVSAAVAGLLLAHAVAIVVKLLCGEARRRRRGTMTVVCAWCGRTVRTVRLGSGDHDCVSHGICGLCTARHFGEG